MDTIIIIVEVIIIYLIFKSIIYRIFKPKEFHILQSIRNSFSTEFMWRCYVVTQGAFFLIMIGLADYNYRNYGFSVHLRWYFFFPRIAFNRADEAQWWIGVLYYSIMPYIIVRIVDWVLESKKSD